MRELGVREMVNSLLGGREMDTLLMSVVLELHASFEIIIKSIVSYRISVKKKVINKKEK